MQPPSALFILIVATSTHVHLTDAACKMDGPTKAHCKHMNVSRLPTLTAAAHITLLDYSESHLPRLHADSLPPYRHLRHLYLYGNGMRSIDEHAFAACPHLSTLDLGDNSITHLDDRLFEIDSLVSLVLRRNPLGRVPRIASRSLRLLDLSGCNVSRLAASAFRSLPRLRVLDLSGNRLEALPADAFAGIARLGSACLHDNPWRCDADFVALMRRTEDVNKCGKRVKCSLDGDEYFWSDAGLVKVGYKTSPPLEVYRVLEVGPDESVLAVEQRASDGLVLALVASMICLAVLTALLAAVTWVRWKTSAKVTETEPVPVIRERCEAERQSQCSEHVYERVNYDDV